MSPGSTSTGRKLCSLRQFESNAQGNSRGLPWLVSTLLAIAAAAFPQLLGAATHFVEAQVPANAVFGAGILYLVVSVLSLTILNSANTARVRTLSQECALLRLELDRLSVARGSGEEPTSLGLATDSRPANGSCATASSRR